MIDYIKGNITELNPTEVILECYGIGYRILISLQTYEGLNGKSDAKVYIHHYMREDEELYYGFATKDERELFRLLIGVSGIGASTSRMMLSSLTSDEIRNAILAEDLNKIKSIKGIGTKSAQRLILELKDKLSKGQSVPIVKAASKSKVSSNMQDALLTLEALGYTRSEALQAMTFEGSDTLEVEVLIKEALKRLTRQ